MLLSHIVYVSQARPELGTPELERIVAKSAIANAARDVTGVLICGDGQLMQLLEGDEVIIQTLFDHIRKDPRHEKIELLMKKKVDKRIFREWQMKLVDVRNDAKLDRQRLLNLVSDVSSRLNTGNYSVEARLLLNDFTRQLTDH